MSAGHEAHTERLTEPSRGERSGPSGSDRSLQPGQRLGRYRIERLIGQGGMGAVYLASQTEPVRRQVALKLCRERRLSAEELSRFLVERQVLARMSHPAIAQLLDAGTLEDGSPYFVMEYVEGGRLLDFVQRRALALESRIRLFCDFCHGIEHAHRRGVIHCDLKPSNLLVVEVEGRLQPKVIDFGIARAMAAEVEAGHYAGTPGYMSPEQAMGVADLDTRTDVFSLGILLYELVSGRRFAPSPEPGADTAARQLAALTAAVQGAVLDADALPQLGPLRRAELQAIIAKATASERDQRFGGAQPLAEALQRWLRREAVAEYSDRFAYRIACLVRRHAVLSAVLMSALFVVGLLASQLVLQYQEVKRQRDVAEQTTGLLLETFQAADPYTFPGASMSVRELLSRSAQRTLGRALEPSVKLRLLDALGEVQANLELWQDAHQTRSEALQLARRAGLPMREQARHALEQLRTVVDLEQWQTALDAIAGFALEYGLSADDPLALQADLLRVEVFEYTDRRAEAAALLAALAPRIAQAGDPALRFDWLRFGGRMAVAEQDGGAAIGPLREAYQLAVTLWGESDSRTGIVLSDLALAEALAGELDSAERHRRSLVQLSEDLFGGESVGLAIDLSNLGAFLLRRGGTQRMDEAVAVYRRALDIFDRRMGAESADTGTAANGLASALEARGDHDAASPIYRRAEAAMRAARGESHSLVGIVKHNWGRNELAAGRLQTAQTLLESAGDILVQTLGEAHPRHAIWQHTMARLRLAQGRPEEATQLLQSALPTLRETLAEGSEERRSVERTVEALGLRAGEPDPAPKPG